MLLLPVQRENSEDSLVMVEYRNTVKDGQDHRLGQEVSSNPVLGTQLKWPVKAWKNTTVRIDLQSKYHIGACHDILL